MFDILSIAFLVIIIGFCIIGYFKGFLSLALGLAKGLIAIILASMLCKPLGSALSNTGIGTSIVEKVETSLIEKKDLFEVKLDETNKEVFISNELDQRLDDAKIPSVIKDQIKNLLIDKVEIKNEQTVGAYIGEGIALFVCIIISFIVILILAFILLSILQKLIKNVNHIPLVGLANRLLGVCLSFVISLITIGIICYVLTFLMTIPGDASDWITGTLKIVDGETTNWSFANFMYEHNIIKWVFNIIFS